MTEFKDDVHPFCYTVAGSSSGIVTRAVGQPLDVLKIRFQLQNCIGGKLKYTGIMSATRNIYLTEGVAAFWKGHIPAQGLSIIYGVVKFNTYEYLRKRWYTNHLSITTTPLHRKTAIDFVCGTVAGMTTTFACQPLDVIRTRLVSQEEPRLYSGTLHAMRLMWAESGVRTFFKGVTPALIMICPNVGFNFAFYGFFKNVWITIAGKDVPSKSCILFCGAASGLCSKLILLPFDNVKKRLQVVGFQTNPRYTSMVTCFRDVVAHQGKLALYRGASPSLLKALVTTGISFFSYELVLDCCYKHQLENQLSSGKVT